MQHALGWAVVFRRDNVHLNTVTEGWRKGKGGLVLWGDARASHDSVIIVHELHVVLACLYKSDVIHHDLPTSASSSRSRSHVRLWRVRAPRHDAPRSSASRPGWRRGHHVRLALRLQGHADSGSHAVIDGHGF